MSPVPDVLSIPGADQLELATSSASSEATASRTLDHLIRSIIRQPLSEAARGTALMIILIGMGINGETCEILHTAGDLLRSLSSESKEGLLSLVFLHPPPPGPDRVPREQWTHEETRHWYLGRVYHHLVHTTTTPAS
jgi:hypothetical protein